ncbi:putative olfactory receptor 13C6 [Clupea harengus]|uniref:Olfactory receptor n=1 Tax=Clupea harengus TaxID=7950 RepID=A0A6P8G2F1_CLUHA|nr:putative olfactory receptor 13C6 [Clupea harengus]
MPQAQLPPSWSQMPLTPVSQDSHMPQAQMRIPPFLPFLLDSRHCRGRLKDHPAPQDRGGDSNYFIFIIIVFLFTLIGNLVLLLTILLNKSLHQPMYLLLLNLPINDIIGSSALFPQVINELLLDSRSIQYAACITQAFLIHIYGTGSVFILTAMAYDRYVAICCPLQYGTIMTNAHVMRIISLVWLCNLFVIGVLFFLLLRLPRCGSQMAHSYCDNPSLLRLACTDTTVNNIYGLALF